MFFFVSLTRHTQTKKKNKKTKTKISMQTRSLFNGQVFLRFVNGANNKTTTRRQWFEDASVIRLDAAFQLRVQSSVHMVFYTQDKKYCIISSSTRTEKSKALNLQSNQFRIKRLLLFPLDKTSIYCIVGGWMWKWWVPFENYPPLSSVTHAAICLFVFFFFIFHRLGMFYCFNMR